MLSPERMEHLRQELLREQARLRRDIEGMNTDELSTDAEIGVGNHMADDATEVFNQEAQLSLRHNDQHILSEINDALRRMDRGTYGTCERCGREIDYARLEAEPYARFCLDDQRLIETENSL